MAATNYLRPWQRDLLTINPQVVEKRCREDPPLQFLAAVQQFNHSEFWECHETLEEIWMEEAESIRVLYKGILHVGIGFFHLLGENYHGATTKLHSGIEMLRPFAPRCMGVEVGKLLAAAEYCLQAVQELGRERIAEFDVKLIPQITLSKEQAKEKSNGQASRG